MIAAYNSGSTMARILESLEPGTPVFVGETQVGDVRAVYAEGDARSAELLVVHWDATGDDVAVPATEVQDLSERGVELMRRESDQDAGWPSFDAERFPTMKRIA